MSIAVKCGNCGKKYSAPDRVAGKSLKCKKCGHAVQIPKPGADDEGDFLNALDSAVEDEGAADSLPSPAVEQKVKKSSTKTKGGKGKKKKKPRVTCPDCGSWDIRQFRDEEHLLPLQKCRECGHIFQIPLTKIQSIGIMCIGVILLIVGVGLFTSDAFMASNYKPDPSNIGESVGGFFNTTRGPAVRILILGAVFVSGAACILVPLAKLLGADKDDEFLV